MSPHLVNAIHELETSLDDIHRKYESSVYSERTLQARKFHATAVTVEMPLLSSNPSSVRGRFLLKTKTTLG